MTEQQLISKRIEYYCAIKEISYYKLAYQSTVPLTTLMHILDGTTKNPGIFTMIKICNGFGITIKDFFDSKEFENIEFIVE